MYTGLDEKIFEDTTCWDRYDCGDEGDSKNLKANPELLNKE